MPRSGRTASSPTCRTPGRSRRKLTINYGLRWEIYFPQYVNGKDNGGFQNLATGEVMIAGENGVGLNGNVKTAFTHFAPRIGIAYQLEPKTVIRAGYGRSYDVGVFGVSFGHNVTQNLPVLANQSLNPAQPWLSVFTLAQRRSRGARSRRRSWLRSPRDRTAIRFCRTASRPNVLPLTTNNTMRLPVVDAWNFTLEHQFSSSTVLSIGYVGNKGYHVTPGGTNYNINQPTIVGFGTLSTNQRRLFFQKFGWTQSIKYFSDDASVKFNSLQVRGEKRFAERPAVPGQLHLGQRVRLRQRLFLLEPRSSSTAVRTACAGSCSTSTACTSCRSARASTFLKNGLPRARTCCSAAGRLPGVGTWESGYPVHAGLRELRQRRGYRAVPRQPGRRCQVSTIPTQKAWYLTAPAGHQRPGLPGDRDADAAAERQRLHARSMEPSGRRDVRQRGAQFVLRAAFLQRGRVVEQAVPDHGEVQRAVPGGDVQRLQPREPRPAERHRWIRRPPARSSRIASLAQMRKWQLGLRVQF